MFQYDTEWHTYWPQAELCLAAIFQPKQLSPHLFPATYKQTTQPVTYLYTEL